MSQNETNSIVSTASGMAGGMGKALSLNPLFATISMQAILEVALYAAVSALVGYGVKIMIDFIRKPRRK